MERTIEWSPTSSVSISPASSIEDVSFHLPRARFEEDTKSTKRNETKRNEEETKSTKLNEEDTKSTKRNEEDTKSTKRNEEKPKQSKPKESKDSKEQIVHRERPKPYDFKFY